MTPRDQAPRRNDPGRCHGSGLGSIAMSAKGCDMVEAARPDLPLGAATLARICRVGGG